MAIRTLVEARQALDDLIPTLSQYWVAQYQQILASHENEVKRKAQSLVDELSGQVEQIRTTALKELTSVRDELDALTKQGSLGRISAADYGAQLKSLADRQASAEDALRKATETTERIDSVEQDPIAYHSDLQQRFLDLRQEFPW